MCLTSKKNYDLWVVYKYLLLLAGSTKFNIIS